MATWDDDTTAVYQPPSSTTAADFDQYYLSYPLSHINKTNLESGNKIIMPHSALNQLSSLPLSYPILFRIQNTPTGPHSHCGVLDFTAEEGFVYMPTWMMHNMQLQQGQLVNIKYTSLPKGEYIKIQPHATKFTTLSDHKSLLEQAFRDFVCLTAGDTIVVNHLGEEYMIDVLETKPSSAVLMFETDCEVDFAQPLDYKEPEKKATVDDDQNHTKKKMECKLFPGVGRRLGGRVFKKIKMTECSTTVEDYGKQEKKQEIKFKPFSGVGRRVDGQALSRVADEEIAQQDQSSNMQVDEKIGFTAFMGKSYSLS